MALETDSPGSKLLCLELYLSGPPFPHLQSRNEYQRTCKLWKAINMRTDTKQSDSKWTRASSPLDSPVIQVEGDVNILRISSEIKPASSKASRVSSREALSDTGTCTNYPVFLVTRLIVHVLYLSLRILGAANSNIKDLYYFWSTTRPYCMAQRTIFNILWYIIMEKNMVFWKKNAYIHKQITLLCSRN